MERQFMHGILVLICLIGHFPVHFFQEAQHVNVTYKRAKTVVLVFLGERMEVLMEHKNDMVKLHRALLEENLNCIGARFLYEFYMSPYFKTAYVVFIGAGAGDIEFEYNEYVTNSTFIHRDDFKVFRFEPTPNLTSVTMLQLKGEYGWGGKENFFVALPGVTIVESRYYIVKDEKSPLMISVVTETLNNLTWTYGMYNKHHDLLKVEGTMPWRCDEDPPEMEIYLQLRTTNIALRTRLFLIDRLEVYREEDLLVYNNVEREKECERVSFETCDIFHVEVSFEYIPPACFYSFYVSLNHTELYPCLIKMKIGYYVETVDSMIAFDYQFMYFKYDINAGQDSTRSKRRGISWIIILIMLMVVL